MSQLHSLTNSACSPCDSLRPAQEDGKDSFEIDEHVLADNQKIQESTGLTCLMAIAASNSQSQPMSSALVQVGSFDVVNPTGMVPKLVQHTFDGHESLYLNTTELKAVVKQGKVGALERPSLLNALAFKCKNPTCADGQCSKQLDEINVHDLRQAWSVSLIKNGYTDASSSEAVLRTFCAQYKPANGDQKATFTPMTVRIRTRNGGLQDVPLCISTWAVVVANMPVGTLTKLRADVPRRISEFMSNTVQALTFAGCSSDARDLAEGSKKVISEGQKFKFLRF